MRRALVRCKKIPFNTNYLIFISILTMPFPAILSLLRPPSAIYDSYRKKRFISIHECPKILFRCAYNVRQASVFITVKNYWYPENLPLLGYCMVQSRFPPVCHFCSGADISEWLWGVVSCCDVSFTAFCHNSATNQR